MCNEMDETYSQKLPALLTCSQPVIIPPRAKPKLVGTKIDPAEAGDQLRTAMAYTGV
jgi:hypothetical protein